MSIMYASDDNLFRNSPNLANEIRLLQGRASPAATDAPSLFAAICRTIGLWRRRSRERAALARFTREDMRDLGISRVDVMREVRKPFWRA